MYYIGRLCGRLPLVALVLNDCHIFEVRPINWNSKEMIWYILSRTNKQNNQNDDQADHYRDQIVLAQQVAKYNALI